MREPLEMTQERRLLVPGKTCAEIHSVDEAGVLVDAESYYRAVHRAIVRAKRYVLMSGWQFDTDVELLRGDDARSPEAPTSLLALLTWASERNPKLEIYMLAWDFSPVFLREREWHQKETFGSIPTQRVSFLWDSFLTPHASFHQKLFVVDGQVAFVGGIDICTSRWDRRAHELDDPSRTNREGGPSKAYHDMQAFVRGPAVKPLEDLFCERWLHNGGERLELSAVDAPPALPELGEASMRIGLPTIAFGQTRVAPDKAGLAPLRHIRELYVAAIEAAERLVYIEQQYFTSRVVLGAFLKRLGDPERAKLQIVIVIPEGGDTPKEKFALGEAQGFVLNGIRCAAEQNGHAFGVYFTGVLDANGEMKSTFVHSKLLVVDDRLLSVGSANLTNRSLGLDTELNLTWENDAAFEDIANLRASLLAEHCGEPSPEPFLSIDGLVEKLEARIGSSRLQRYPIEAADDCDPLLSLATDPTQPLTVEGLDARIEEAWESFDAGWFEKGISRWLARHDRADIPRDPE